MHYLNMYCHISLFNYPVFKKVIPINFGEHMLKFCECEFNATTYAVVFIMQVFFWNIARCTVFENLSKSSNLQNPNFWENIEWNK